MYRTVQQIPIYLVVAILSCKHKKFQVFGTGFFIQADRLGISSRVSVYINNGDAVVVSHHTEGVHFCRLDDMQCFALMIYKTSF